MRSDDPIHFETLLGSSSSRPNRNGTPLCTSAEVLQEMVHAYLPVARFQTLDAAMALVLRSRVEVWPLQEEDVTLARQLHEQYPSLSPRDLCHLASCRRRGVSEVKTFDQALRAAAGARIADPVSMK